MERYAALLRRRPPSLLFGHAHSLYLFAQFLQRAPVTAIRPRGHHFHRAWSCTIGSGPRSRRRFSAGDQPLRLRGGESDRLRVRTARGTARQCRRHLPGMLRPDGTPCRRASRAYRGHRPSEPGHADHPLPGGRHGRAGRIAVLAAAAGCRSWNGSRAASPITW